MQRSTFSFFLLGLALPLLLVGCDNLTDVTEMNENPTAATQMEPSLQLANIPLSISDERFEAWRGNLIHASCITQHLASTTTAWSGCYYTLNESYSTAYWGRHWDELRNIEDVLQKTDPEQNPDRTNMHAMTRILRVFVMHRMTDLYGNIPYEEAGKGVTEQNFNPSYQDQSEIYPAMISDLQEARGQLDPSVSTMDPSRDVLFGGDVEKWRRFANSLILRLGMRMSEVNESAAQSAVQDALNSGVMDANDDMAYTTHVASNGVRYGVGQVFNDFPNGGHAFRMSKTFIDVLRGRTGTSSDMDPRINIFAAQYDDNDNLVTDDPAALEGLENGLQPEELPSNTFTRAQPNREFMVRYSSPDLWMSYAEVKFLEAEAALRGWHPNNSDAQAHYEEGIRAAMKHLTIYGAPEIADSEITDYLASLPDRDPTLEEIIEQKWIALFLNGYEAWAEFRRTGYPDEVRTNPVNAPASETPQDEFPGRLVYPTGESRLNPNFEEGSTQPNEMATRLWWARDPGQTATIN
jgi:hypothetical protein